MNYIINSKLLCLILFGIVSQLINISPFTSLWGGSVSVDFVFMIKLPSIKGKKAHHFISSYKSILILTFIINLIINFYIFTELHYVIVHSPHTTDANPDGKGCLTA
jgi:hypothetical protein